jgi:hypothetical protein
MWRSVVSLEDQVVFDEAIGAIWPKHEFSDHDPQLDDPPSTPKLLQYFQGLAQNLISDATGSLSSANPLPHGTESGGGTPSLGFERPLIYSFPQEQLESIEHTMPPIYLASSTNVSTEVLRLISTAFVGLVIAFLLGKSVRWPSNEGELLMGRSSSQKSGNYLEDPRSPHYPYPGFAGTRLQLGLQLRPLRPLSWLVFYNSSERPRTNARSGKFPR